jgi:nitroreductase
MDVYETKYKGCGKMNDVIKAIKERRTIRKYKNQQIKNDELQTILEAGLFAPSGTNQQSWHFTVVQDQELIRELDYEAKEFFKQSEEESLRIVGNNELFMPSYGSPTIIIVSGQNGNYHVKEDCGAATQNMLLAAYSIGIGTCWNAALTAAFGGEKSDYLRARLQIPEGYTPLYGISLGYAETIPLNAPKRKENKVHLIN